jgi:alpha-galactosidase
MRVRKVFILLGLFVAAPCWAQNNLSNAFINLGVNPQTGTWSCSWKDGTPIFTRGTATVVTSTGVLKTTDDRFLRKAEESPFQDAMGNGRQIALSLSERASGLSWQVTIKLYDQFAGLRIDWHLDNSAKSKLDLKTVTVVEADAPSPDRGYRSGIPVLTSGFNSWDYSHVARVRSSEMVHSSDFFAVEASRLVTGFLSAAAAYGTFDYSLRSEHTLTLRSTAEFNVVVEPGKSRDTDPLLVLFPTDIFEGLEHYAAAVEKFNGIHPRQYSSTTWCSWYAGYGRAEQANLGALEKAMTVNARLMKPLVPLGADTLRLVDDSNDQRYGDWNFPFVPHGMGRLADALHAEGMKAGMWLAPAWASESSDLFKQHPDWLQRDAYGELVTSRQFYGNLMHFLDASNPAARKNLHDLFTQIRNWGYQYVMTDFLYMFGLSDHYQDPHLTRAEVYRAALKTIREALGPDIYLLGCGAPQLASVGLVDGMRIGPDAWGRVGYENIASRYFEAGKWWLNDPDALVGNNRPVEGFRAWVTLASVSGSVLTIGDDLDMLSAEKLDILKHILPARGKVGRPVDLFSAQPNNVWLLPTDVGAAKSGVLGVFNWGGTEPWKQRLVPKELLKTNQNVLVYDFWDDYATDTPDGELTAEVPPGETKTFCLVEPTGKPQALAVSNYLPQSGHGLDAVAWSDAERTLGGKTAGANGDLYHITFYAPAGYAPDKAMVNGEDVFLVSQKKNVWVIPVAGRGASVSWSVHFK